MIQKVAPTPTPCRTSFKRNLTPLEKSQLMRSDVKTLLDVGVKTAQGIITPNVEAYEDLCNFSLKHHHAGTTEKAMGFIPAVRRFFATFDEYDAPQNRAPFLNPQEDLTPFERKDALGMLSVAFDIGRGRIPHKAARAMCAAPIDFPPEFKMLANVIPKEITPVHYSVDGVEKVTE